MRKKLATILDEAQLKQWKGFGKHVTEPQPQRQVTVTLARLIPSRRRDIEVEISCPPLPASA